MTLHTRLSSLLLALPLLGAAGAALADDAAILNCRAMADTAARLACYDAIPVGTRAAATTAAGAVAAAPVAAVPAAAPALPPEQAFGLEQTKRPEAPKSIDSTIPGRFAGWGPSSMFTLANGQVWKVVDGSSADLQPVQDPKVRIVRNLFGTMFLEIDGTNNSPKVRRVR